VDNMKHSRSTQAQSWPCMHLISSSGVLQLTRGREYSLKPWQMAPYAHAASQHSLLCDCCHCTAMPHPNYRTARITSHRWQTRRWHRQLVAATSRAEEGMPEQASLPFLDFVGSDGHQAGKTCSCNGVVVPLSAYTSG